MYVRGFPTIRSCFRNLAHRLADLHRLETTIPYVLHLNQVLCASGSSYASDVYSFGIVAWEVLSRKIPWESVTHPREVYIRVVLNELRPGIPVDAPADMATMIRACWAGDPGARPTFSSIIERIESNGWSKQQVDISPPSGIFGGGLRDNLHSHFV